MVHVVFFLLVLSLAIDVSTLVQLENLSRRIKQSVLV